MGEGEKGNSPWAMENGTERKREDAQLSSSGNKKGASISKINGTQPICKSQQGVDVERNKQCQIVVCSCESGGGTSTQCAIWQRTLHTREQIAHVVAR